MYFFEKSCHKFSGSGVFPIDTGNCSSLLHNIQEKQLYVLVNFIIIG